MAELRMTLPLENPDGSPVTLDDALGLWTAILRLTVECGWLSPEARCDFDGVEPWNDETPPPRRA